MEKVYIVVSTHERGRLAGIYGPDEDQLDGDAITDRLRASEAPEEMQEAIRKELQALFLDAAEMVCAAHLPKALIFQRRKTAREIAARLNGGDFWTWRVIEVGDPTPRDVRPVLGWRLTVGGCASAFNAEDEGATVVLPGSSEARFDTDYRLFPTRAKARSVVQSTPKDMRDFYRVVPVYTAYRVDVCYDVNAEHPEWTEGALRFRTKQAAENFIDETYTSAGIEARVVLMDEPVPEDVLYVPW